MSLESWTSKISNPLIITKIIFINSICQVMLKKYNKIFMFTRTCVVGIKAKLKLIVSFKNTALHKWVVNMQQHAELSIYGFTHFTRDSSANPGSKSSSASEPSSMSSSGEPSHHLFILSEANTEQNLRFVICTPGMSSIR